MRSTALVRAGGMAMAAAGCGMGAVALAIAASRDDIDQVIHPVAAIVLVAVIAVAMVGLHSHVMGRVPLSTFGIALGLAFGAALVELIGGQAGLGIGSSSFVLAFVALTFLLIGGKPYWRVGQAGIFLVLCAFLTGLAYVLGGVAFEDVKARIDEQIPYELALGFVLLAMAVVLSRELPFVPRMLSLLGVVIPAAFLGVESARPYVFAVGGACWLVGWAWLGVIMVRASAAPARH